MIIDFGMSNTRIEPPKHAAIELTVNSLSSIPDLWLTTNFSKNRKLRIRRYTADDSNLYIYNCHCNKRVSYMHGTLIRQNFHQWS